MIYLGQPQSCTVYLAKKAKAKADSRAVMKLCSLFANTSNSNSRLSAYKVFILERFDPETVCILFCRSNCVSYIRFCCSALCFVSNLSLVVGNLDIVYDCIT